MAILRPNRRLSSPFLTTPRAAVATVILRPESTISLGTWQPANPHLQIDESVVNDGDYTQSAVNPSSDTVEVKLESGTDPIVHTDHTVRYRYGKNPNATGAVNLTVGLYQGATKIAEAVHTNIGTGFTNGSLTLTTTQAANITDYTDLRLRFTASSS